MDIATLAIKADTTDLKKLNTKLDEVAKKGKQTETATQRLEKSFSSLAKGVAIAGTAMVAAIGAIGIKSIAVFSEIETGLVAVQKTTDFTATEMKTFETSINSIGRTVPVATTELLKIASAAGQLGIDGVENVTVFTDTIAKLALASDIVGEEGATSIARLLNITGEAIETVPMFASVLVALGNNSAATESEILSLATEIGQATSTFSVTSAETLALGAAMKSLGVRAELGGSVVGRAMRTIEDSISSGGEKIQLLSEITGIASDDLKKAFGDNSTKVFQKWIEGVGKMVKGGESAANVLGRFGLKGEEVLKVLPTMAVNSSELAEALNLMNDELETGTALEDEAAKASDTLASKWQIAKNMAGEIAKTIGENLAPTISGMLEDFGAWYDVNDELIKQDLQNFIEGIVPVLSTMANVVGNITASFAGWAAVSQDRLDFLEFATMDAKEMSEWLEKDRLGLVELENQIETLRDESANIRFSVFDGGEGSKARKQAIQDEITLLKQQKDAILNISEAEADLNGETGGYINTLKEVKIQAITTGETENAIIESILVGKRKIVKYTEEDMIKAEEKFAEDKLGVAEKLEEDINKLTLSEFDYKILKLDEEIAAFEKFAVGDAELQERIKEYRILKTKEFTDDVVEKNDNIKEDSKEAVWDMATEWGKATQEIASSYGDNVESALLKSFGETENAWSSMLNSMLAKLGSVVAEMAVTWAASAVADFAGWSLPKHHDGLWNLQDDEHLSILQRGEMVIPSGQSDRIRDNLGAMGARGSFDDLVAATGHSDPDGWVGDVIGDIGNNYKGSLIAGIVQALMTGNMGGAIADIMSPEVGMKNIGTPMVNRSLEAFSAPGGSYTDAGSMITQALAVATMGIGNIPFVGELLSFVGGWAGNKLGDVLNDREFESIRDAVEDGTISAGMGANMIQTQMSSGAPMTGGSALGGVLSGIGGAISSVTNFIDFTRIQNAIDDFINGGAEDFNFSSRQFGESAESAVDRNLEEFFGDIDNAQAAYSSGSGGSGYSAGHSTGTDGGYTTADGGVTGLASGGVVNRLMVPNGDDGFAALKLGEGVINADTMKVLSNSINNGTFSGSNEMLVEILQTLKTVGLAIATHTQSTSRTLESWDFNGLPQERA